MLKISSDELCARQFAVAVEANRSYVHAYGVNDYYFGITQGLTTLQELPTGVERPTILDIGAGYGTYLTAVRTTMAACGKEARTIGMTAIDKRHTEEDGVEWVFGDFQRPSTWSPRETLQEGTVDLAVSRLTFQHLADPVRALRTALGLLKEGGSLFIDDLPLRIGEENREATAVYIEQELHKTIGRWGMGTPRWDRHGQFVLCALHLQRQTELPLEGLTLTDEYLGRAVYTL